nr:uncharacterized protein LOC128697399 [Cherax quadricarinatus]
MLEKDFLKKNIDIRDMVRLVKLVGVVLEWPQKYGLKAFHIKRLALKFSDQLKQKSKWDGYRFLLERLRSELQQNKVLYGFFIRNQVIYNKKPDIVEKFCKDISEVYFWTPSVVKDKVQQYIGC